MNKFLRRLEQIENALAGGCASCARPIAAAGDEEAFLREWSAPCPVCGRQRTFADLAVEATAAAAIEGFQRGLDDEN